MTKRLILIPVLALALASCNPYEDPGSNQDSAVAPDAIQSDGGITDTGLGEGGTTSEAGPDKGSADGGSNPSGEEILPAGATATWAKRDCSYTIKYFAPGASKVLLAASFTTWDKHAIAMTKKGSTWETTITPNGTTQVSGTRYPYKFIVDGSWTLDKAAPLRVFDGNCINSGFLLPPCDAAPEIKPGKLTATYSSGKGSAKVKVAILAAKDGSAPASVRAALNGKPLPKGAAVLDKGAGAFNISLSGLAPGKYTLRLRASDAKGRAADEVYLPFWVEAEAFDLRDGLLYMLLIDRFANGDTAIDKSAGCSYPSDWHGGDLKGATDVLKSGYLNKMGVRTIWISPVNQQVDGCYKGRGSDPNTYSGYHGYWPIKARQVDTRFGGGAALKAFVAEAHKQGIRVLVDLINNQVHEKHEYYLKNPSWFRKGCVCGVDANCGWSQKPFECLFDKYLPDINWRIPAAEKQFIDDAIYWITEFDLDGFRVDAVKHVEPNSVYNLRARLAQRMEQGGARIYLLGETAVGEGDSYNFFCESFSDGYQWIDSYTGKNGMDGQFDFPTHHQTQSGLTGGSSGFDSIESVIKKAESKYTDASRHVRFLGAHDSTRMASMAANDSKKGCKWAKDCGGSLAAGAYTAVDTYKKLKRALTVLFTMPGIPFLYAGDEVALPGGGDPDNRRDMIWTGSISKLTMTKGGGPTSLNAQQTDLLAFVRALGKARATNKALRRGTRTTLWSSSDLYVYSWHGSGSKELALVAVNRGSSAVTAKSVGSVPLSGGATSLKIAAGKGTATLSGKAVKVTIGAGEAALFLGQ